MNTKTLFVFLDGKDAVSLEKMRVDDETELAYSLTIALDKPVSWNTLMIQFESRKII